MRAYDELFNGSMSEDDDVLLAREKAASEQQKKNADAKAAQENALRPLLAELGGDSPQNRAIAEGLQKQGIGSTKDIGVRTVMETRYQPPIEDVTPGGSEEVPVKQFYNKTDGNAINPTRLGIYDVKDGDKVQGNIFFHLNADDNGNVSFQPQWSPRARGFLRDNAVGRLIMTAGKIIPSPAQPFFVAASAIDSLAHGNVMQAVAAAIPYGIQALAGSSELLSNISGNPDFVSTAKTAAGKIAEAAGAPAYAADLVGKVATSGITAGITGGDVGEAMLKAGASSILGESKDFLKAAGDFSKMGIGGLLPDGISASDFDADALNDLKESLSEVDVSPETISPAFEGKGWGEIGEGEFADEIKPDVTARDTIGQSLESKDGISSLQENNQVAETSPVETPVIKTIENPSAGITSLDPKDLQSVYEQENPGAANYSLEGGAGSDYVSPSDGTGGMVDDAGNATDKIDLDTVTVRPGWNSWEGDDNIDETAPLTLPPGAGPDEDKPEEDYLLNPDDPYSKLELPPGAAPDEKKPEEKYLLNPDEEPSVSLPKVPPIFPSKPPVSTKPPVLPPAKPKLDLTGLESLIAGLVAGTSIDKKEEAPKAPVDLTGGYKFDWNAQQTKGPENGVAYGQKYYGNHWGEFDKTEAPKIEPPEIDPNKEYSTMPINEYGPPIIFAEGGLTSISQQMFKPTMIDSGIMASQISKDDITNQAIQHMRKGGHVVDHKTHKEVSYLAGKGEPVHHIVGFMNHRKRMAEGGITSHSLGSYSDGGHLLKGPGDGMSDDIPATIADKQPARLANEEFVIPADVVSHLGNGSSESGAKVLYEMMAKVRKARTGNPKQGKQIDPHKLLPKV